MVNERHVRVHQADTQFITGNKTYAEWAGKAWDWMTDVGLIGTHDAGPGYSVFDGTYVGNNCSTVASWIQWTYSAGMLLNAAAVMWNVTQDPMWEDRANGIWTSAHVGDSQLFDWCRGSADSIDFI